MQTALLFCFLGRRSMDVPKKITVEAMLQVQAEPMQEGGVGLA